VSLLPWGEGAQGGGGNEDEAGNRKSNNNKVTAGIGQLAVSQHKGVARWAILEHWLEELLEGTGAAVRASTLVQNRLCPHLRQPYVS